MATNNSRDEMLAQGLPSGGTIETRLITNRPRICTFDLYAADGRYLGTMASESAQQAYDDWYEMFGEIAGLVEEMD